MIETLFHGGPLFSEYRLGYTFWTWKPWQAAEYMRGSDDLRVIEVDLDREVVVDESAYTRGSYVECESNEANWELQQANILAAIEAGATIVRCDDGWAVKDANRFSPRIIAVDEALSLVQD